MLASKYRFHRRNHVNRVYKQGKSVRGSVVSLKYRFDSGKKEIRIAVVVSKKVAKSAVKRNRIRRRIFEVVRVNIDAIEPGFEGVFGVYDSRVQDMPSEKLNTLILDLLERAK